MSASDTMAWRAPRTILAGLVSVIALALVGTAASSRPAGAVTSRSGGRSIVVENPEAGWLPTTADTAAAVQTIDGTVELLGKTPTVSIGIWKSPSGAQELVVNVLELQDHQWGTLTRLLALGAPCVWLNGPHPGSTTTTTPATVSTPSGASSATCTGTRTATEIVFDRGSYEATVVGVGMSLDAIEPVAKQEAALLPAGGGGLLGLHLSTPELVGGAIVLVLAFGATLRWASRRNAVRPTPVGGHPGPSSPPLGAAGGGSVAGGAMGSIGPAPGGAVAPHARSTTHHDAPLPTLRAVRTGMTGTPAAAPLPGDADAFGAGPAGPTMSGAAVFAPPPVLGASPLQSAAPPPPPAAAGVVVPAPVTPAPAWHPDPYRRFALRYWSGSAWTEHVSAHGVSGIDAVPGAPLGPGA